MVDDRTTSLLGVDNIAVELPIAGLGSRSLAVLIDYFAVAFLQISALFVIGLLLPSWPALAFVVLTLALFVIDWSYFAGLEMLLGGRTLGKMALKIRVVDQSTGAASRASLAIRNLLRLPDLLVGIPLMVTDPRARRLGDRLAGTLVLHDDRMEAPVTLGRIPHGWGAREVEVVESYLRRESEMEPAQRLFLGRRLVRLLESEAPELLGGVADPDEDPVAILRQALEVEG